MKKLIATLLLLVSTSVFASGEIITHNNNSVWEYNNDEANGEFTITSEMPNTDISLVYSLNTEAGWALSIRFGENTLQPTDIATMGVAYYFDGKHYGMDSWKTVDRDVVIVMSIDNVWALHSLLENSDDSAKISITYKSKAAVAEAGGSNWDADGVNLEFDLKNKWDAKFHKIIDTVVSTDAEKWLQGTTYFRNQPVNELPEGKKPTPSKMIEAAQRANIDIDMAYTLSINELVKLARDIAIEKQLEARKIREAEQAERRRLAELERQRVAAEKEAAKQAQAAKYNAAKVKIRDFDWPSAGCGSPSKIGIGASDYKVEKANRRNNNWYDCMDDAWKGDESAFKRLISNLSDAGGSWEWVDRTKGQYSYKIHTACDGCREALKQINNEIIPRHESRMKTTAALNDWIDSRNSRQDDKNSSDEMWDGINDALERSQREMDEMYRQRQQWNNNQIYITPGYN